MRYNRILQIASTIYYHADSKIVVCVDSFTYFLLLHCWGCLMHKPKTNQPTKTKKKTGNFNRGKCLGLPLTGFDMLVKINSVFTNGQAANEKTCQTLLKWLTGN